MAYQQSIKQRSVAQNYFKDHRDQFAGVSDALDVFYDSPSLSTAREVMRLYFKGHEQGNIEGLNIIASAFADKRLALSIVDSIIDDPEALDYIAEKSYPHPIGFDKMVLYHDPDTNFKFRLHVYWRGNQRMDMERTHLHRFEMASAIISGELTNHTWAVTQFNAAADNTIVPSMQFGNPSDDAERQNMHAYTGYWRDPADNVLHKKHIGSCELGRLSSETFVSGQSYAQLLQDAHYVETNAETGLGNGDVCSTIYIHSGGLKDDEGRSLPILFEEEELENADQIIDPIPNMSVDELKSKLIKYKTFIENNLEFYDWVYDEKHGRNLSTGMIAGYLIAEKYKNPHTLSVWIEHEEDCKSLLKYHADIIRQLVKNKRSLDEISDDDRNKRYYGILLRKALDHPQGPEYWLENYGDLVKEMWRYCGAIKGEKPQITELKPIWEDAVGKKLPGGAHYGHVAAMLEAAYEVKPILMKAFREGVVMEFKSSREVVTALDKKVEHMIKERLAQYYPEYSFYGEETGDNSPKNPDNGDKRWVVDPIDGTRNFASGLNDFAVSIACQEFKDGEWVATDGVISIPSIDKIYWAEKGHGAYCIEGNDIEHKITDTEFKQPHNDPMDATITNMSVRGLSKEAEKSLLNYSVDHNMSQRNTGSVATMLCLSSVNPNHICVMTAKEYDVAAGLLIAEEAGVLINRFGFTHNNEDQTIYVATKNNNAYEILSAQVQRSLQVSHKTPDLTSHLTP